MMSWSVHGSDSTKTRRFYGSSSYQVMTRTRPNGDCGAGRQIHTKTTPQDVGVRSESYRHRSYHPLSLCTRSAVVGNPEMGDGHRVILREALDNCLERTNDDDRQTLRYRPCPFSRRAPGAGLTGFAPGNA